MVVIHQIALDWVVLVEYYDDGCEFTSFSMLKDVILPQGMALHGVAVYDDILYTMNGFGDIDAYILDSYSIDLLSAGATWKQLI